MADMKHWTEAATFKGNVPWTWDGIQVALLIRISEQLEKLLILANCPNVKKGFIAMAALDRRVRQRLAKPRPRTLKALKRGGK